MTKETFLITEALNKVFVQEALDAKDMRIEKDIDGFKVKFVVKKDRDWEEWQVKVYINGKYDDDQSYFALGGTKEDKEDAIATMKKMAETFKIPEKYKK